MLNKEVFLKKKMSSSSICIIVVWIVVFMVLIPVNMLNLAESSAESFIYSKQTWLNLQINPKYQRWWTWTSNRLDFWHELRWLM